MAEPRKITVSSEAFRDQVNAFVEDFIRYIREGRNYPISRIFDKLPLTPENDETQQSITDRGDIRISGNTIDNEGDLIIATFNDAAVGEVQITLLDRLEAQTEVSGDTLTLNFVALPISVRLFSQQYELLVLTFTPTVVTYLFREISNQDNQILLVANLASTESLTQSQEVGQSYSERPLFNLLMNGLQEDGGCGVGTISSSKTEWTIWHGNNNDNDCKITTSSTSQPDPYHPNNFGTYNTYEKAKEALEKFKEEGKCGEFSG